MRPVVHPTHRASYLAHELAVADKEIAALRLRLSALESRGTATATAAAAAAGEAATTKTATGTTTGTTTWTLTGEDVSTKLRTETWPRGLLPVHTHVPTPPADYVTRLRVPVHELHGEGREKVLGNMLRRIGDSHDDPDEELSKLMQDGCSPDDILAELRGQ